MTAVAHTPLPAMLPEHRSVFLEAAKKLRVYILVRRTNLASLRFIGKPGYSAKDIDCKAKTADSKVNLPGIGEIDCAGLVVDPFLTGPAAFKSPAKYEKALKAWNDFAGARLHDTLKSFLGQQQTRFLPSGYRYFVELDPKSPRYGCVCEGMNGTTWMRRYIHGDFDLYAIVRADQPQQAMAAFGKMRGSNHSFSPHFRAVQEFVNSRIGAEVIRHGEQESFQDDHSDEDIDVFHPTGLITYCVNGAEIARLYEETFRGRPLFSEEQRSYADPYGLEFQGFKPAR